MKTFEIQAKYTVSVEGTDKLERLMKLSSKLEGNLSKTAKSNARLETSLKGMGNGAGIASGKVERLGSVFEQSKNKINTWANYAKTAAQNVVGAFTNIGNKINAAVDSVGRVAVPIMATVAVGGAALGGAAIAKSVNLAADFESQMSGAGAVLSATGDEMKNLERLALAMGKKTSFSAKQAAEGIEQLGSSGLNAKQILAGGLEGTLALAAATGVKDLGFAAEVGAASVNAFGLKSEQLASVANTVANAANVSALKVGGFRDSLASGGSVAKQFGLSLTDFTSVISLMADKAISGSDAGTSLKAMLLNAATATGKTKTMMDKLGFSLYDKSGKMKSLESITSNLITTTKGMTDADKNYFLNQVFGSDGIRTANILLGAGTGKLLERKKALEVAGAAEKAAKMRLDNLRGSQEQFSGSLETLGITIGKSFTPAFKRMTDDATNGVNFILEKFSNPRISKSLDGLAMRGAKSFNRILGGAVGSLEKFLTPKSMPTGKMVFDREVRMKVPETKLLSPLEVELDRLENRLTKLGNWWNTQGAPFARGFGDGFGAAIKTIGQAAQMAGKFVGDLRTGLQGIPFAKELGLQVPKDKSGKPQPGVSAGEWGGVAGTAAAVMGTAMVAGLANKLTGGIVPKVLGGLGKGAIS